MTKVSRTIVAAWCGIFIAASASAQMANTRKPTPGTAHTPRPLTTPGSMNNTPINPATGTPYMPQVNLSNGPISPTVNAINPATGTPYVPQVNMNGPATNDPGVVGKNVSAQPPITTPAPAPQPDAPTATAPLSQVPPQN